MSETYDAIIIGGGPAGATCATVLADHGRRALVIERANYPRFHIGESLMPETYWVFKRIGMLDKMKQSRFIKKYSVKFATPSGKESAPFYFDERNPHECSQTWQVLRSEFDKMMLDNAVEHGAEVWQPATVLDVLLEPTEGGRLPRAKGVIVERDGEQYPVYSKVVVDATGTSAMLSRRFNVRVPDPELHKAAVFAHYKGAIRDKGERDEGAILVLAIENQKGWFWFIPLPDDIMSIGIVADIDYLIKGRGTPEQILEEEIQKCPALIPRLAPAKRVSRVHVLNDFSYNSKVCAGDGWVLVGDAFTFLDPMYSSGVLLALKSGELAGDAIHEALKSGDTSGKSLGRWGDDFYEGVQAVRKMVYAFYSPGFSFGKFIRVHPDKKNHVTEVLIGDVFRPEVHELFKPMGEMCRLPESLKLEPAS
ncbi:MAG: tryptophan 7-halogenase [Phycisphaerae bacterium]|nr:MAG: NAD(P)/FAD-dependent oxidoreductase [Planctomycetota bacterium]KAB2949178.1 MAG: NAD(P)/FAD-dependent oxidoreductase [Phycisphaerae bacterium]MBE7458694.1 tryptophan 7-halogenase [Planctomycetia bacterium]MCK6466016.1 tryptophan 7-halogenase [Phycisphaerae bacterium]MCL4719770.1 tryptophan 7-halogenase [Phycisphaerae bacterium]